MNQITTAAAAKVAALRGALAARFPTLLRKSAKIAATDPSAIILGRDERGAMILLPQRARAEHSLCIGTTGGGKTTHLAHCIRQDIANRAGVLVADPHGEHPGSLYRTTLAWLDRTGYGAKRKIHLIDPNAPSHTIGFNPLARPDAETDLSVIAGSTLEAFSRGWGGENTDQKPTIERVLTATFSALAELDLTLVEAPFLLDRKDMHGLRRFALDRLQDRYSRHELQRLHELSLDERRRHDFDLEVVGPLNRLARFVRPTAIRAMIGQTERVLDFRQAMDEGDIILCNLSGGARVYEKDADLLGRLLVRTLFFHAKRRRAPDRPFYIFLDECHRYLSGDLENVLAEIRKYGVSACLSAQWMGQFRVESDNMLDAVRNATNVKIVFRIKDPQEASQLAETVIPLDLEMPVRALVRPTVIGHRRIRLENESVSEQTAITDALLETRGESKSHSVSYGESHSVTEAENESLSQGEGWSNAQALSQSQAASTAEGASVTDTIAVPQGILGSETLVGISHSSGQTGATALSSGSLSASGKSGSSGRTTGRTSAVTQASNWGESVSHGTSRATTVGRSESSGHASSRGNSEALEPILSDLPSSVHSKDAVLYMAAQTLRNLPTGRAVVNYVGTNGMISSMLNVPRVSEIVLGQKAFALLRQRMLSASPASIPMVEACAHISDREQSLLSRKQAHEEDEPTSFRSRAPSDTAGADWTPPAAAGRGSPRPISKRNRKSSIR